MKIKRTIFGLMILVMIASALVYLVNTQSTLRWIIAQVSAELPGTLKIGNIQGRLFGPIILNNIQFDSRDANLQISELKLHWQPSALIYGRLHIESFIANDIQLILEEASSNQDIQTDIDNVIALYPAFPIDLESVLIRNIKVQRTQSAQAKYIDNISFTSKARINKLFIDALQVLTPSYSVTASGFVVPHSNLTVNAHVQWNWHTPGAVAIQGKALLDGDLSLLKISTALTQPGDIQFKGAAENLITDMVWYGTLVVNDFDYAKHFDIAEPSFLTGEGQINGDLQTLNINGQFGTSLHNFGKVRSHVDLSLTKKLLRIRHANIDHVDSPASIQVQGKVAFTDNTWVFDGRSQWQNLQWPLLGATQLSSPEGQLVGVVSQTDYELEIEKTTIEYDDIAFDEIRTTVIGDYQGLALERLEAHFYDSSIFGSANIDWASGLSWDAEMRSTAINPQQLLALWPEYQKLPGNTEWPGAISVNFTSTGDARDEKINAQINITNSEGTLKGNAFKGSGIIDIRDNTFSSNGVHIKLGKTNLTAAGSIGSNWNIIWDIKQADVAMLYPESAGIISCNGTMTGALHQPVIIAQLQASGIEDNTQQKINSLTVDLNVDMSDKTESRIDVLAKELHYRDYQLNMIKLSATGKQSDHKISVRSKSANDWLDLTLTGTFTDQNWAGEFIEGELHTELAGDWQLMSPAALKVSATRLALDQACWSAKKNARWCATTQWHKGQSLATDLVFDDVPLSLFQPVFNDQFHFNGHLNGTTHLLTEDQNIKQAKIDLRIGKGSVDMILDKKPTKISEFQSGTLIFNQTSSLMNGEFELRFTDQEILTAAVKLTPPNDASSPVKDWPIVGYLKANTRHPDFIRLFYTAIDEISGQWRSDIQLRGTLNNPIVTGYSTIAAPLISIPVAGLTLKDTNLNINSVADNKFGITGGFSSGNGFVEMDGILIADHQQGWPVKLSIAGDHVQVFNIEESEVEISPDLQLQIHGERVDIDGNIEVSKAKIIAGDTIPQSVKISNDVVFIDEQQPAGEKIPKKQSGWDTYSKVNFVLSDEVYFDGYGLTGRLVGKVNIKGEPGKVTTGQGAFHIKEGRFSAFGVSLNMDIGRLIFANDPVDNPAINARASKRSGDITAGVRITGNLTSPEINVFSIPTMPESEALSYLLFGKIVNDTSFGSDSFNPSNGQPGNSGGLNLGDALNPGRYVDYAVGLVNSSSVLRIRFELSKHWELYTESSAAHRGAEVVFTFER